ncbi:Putative MutT-family protein [Kitasatospora purpeofusca]
MTVLRRGPKAKFAQGLQNLPVGKSEPGEPITQTTVRELNEETGLAVAPEDLAPRRRTELPGEERPARHRLRPPH